MLFKKHRSGSHNQISSHLRTWTWLVSRYLRTTKLSSLVELLCTFDTALADLTTAGSSHTSTNYNGLFTKIHFDESTGIKVEGDTSTGIAKIYLDGVASESGGGDGSSINDKLNSMSGGDSHLLKQKFEQIKQENYAADQFETQLNFKKDIAFKNVSFAYNEENLVLNNISFDVEKEINKIRVVVMTPLFFLIFSSIFLKLANRVFLSNKIASIAKYNSVYPI